MIEYLKNLINSNKPESSKRFIALVALLMYIIVVLYGVFTKISIDSTIIYSLVSLILGSSAMTLIQNKQ